MKAKSGYVLLVYTILALMASRLSASGEDPKVMALTQEGIMINIGSAAGVQQGLTGTVYLIQDVGGRKVKNRIAKIVIIRVDNLTSEAKITARTDEVKFGYLVEFDSTLVPPAAKNRQEGKKVEEAEKTDEKSTLKNVADPKAPLPAIAEDGWRGITIEISFQEESWVQVYADGVLKVNGLYPQGATAKARANERLLIHTGNAGGLAFTLNGQPAQPLGRSGQVITDIRISAENIRDFIVSFKPEEMNNSVANAISDENRNLAGEVQPIGSLIAENNALVQSIKKLQGTVIYLRHNDIQDLIAKYFSDPLNRSRFLADDIILEANITIGTAQQNVRIGCLAISERQTVSRTLWLGLIEKPEGPGSVVGRGVLKSVDGGRTWQSMGLLKCRHVSKILLDPNNEDLVYVAAIGHHSEDEPMRGVYMTRDGGKSWLKYLDAVYSGRSVGVFDVSLSRLNSDYIYASTWQRSRPNWDFSGGGPSSLIYKSNDSGKTWRSISFGLPRENRGRIALDINPYNWEELFAIIDYGNALRFFQSNDSGGSWKELSPEEYAKSRYIH